MGEDLQEKAYNVCKEYIGGIWSQIRATDVMMEKLTGGFVHEIIKLSLPSSFHPIGGEPTEVLMRNSDNLFDHGQFGIMTENIIVSLLAEKNLSPKIYGIFDGGRLEEFIPSRLLKSNDLRNPKILEAVVRKLARMHALQLPISKDPNHLYKKMAETLEMELQDLENQIKNEPIRKKVWDKFLSLNPREELNWLMKLKDNLNSPIVFSHNDFYNNNILLRNDPGDDMVQVIDFEMAGYNFRGFDMAGLFYSFTFDLIPEPPYFIIDPNKYPTEEEEKIIFRTYLKEYQQAFDIILDEDKEEKQLLNEFRVFTLIFFYFWITCSLFTPHRSLETLSFRMDYCEAFVDMYLNRKQILSEIQQ